ncbi:MAG: cytochrome c [Gemmataceae bacterium]|nr:cytochrome c [Gemmataceae bacterium]
MLVHTRRCSLCLALLLGHSLFLLDNRESTAQAGMPAVPLSDAEFAQLTEQTARLVYDALKKPDDLAQEKARSAAVLLAAVAQYSQDAANAPRRVPVRDTAFRLSALIKAGKFDDARKLAESLPGLSADEKAKTAAVPIIMKQIEMHEAMRHFGSAKEGGNGAEKRLYDLQTANQKTRTLPAREMKDDLMLLALRLAVTGELVKDHMDAKVKLKPAVWKQHAEEMRRYSLDLARAVEKKDGAAAYKALGNLNDNCNTCHAKFR